MKGKFVASARHLGRSIWKNRACYSLMLPGIIWFILFAYGPMSGLLLAFKTYSARGGIWGSCHDNRYQCQCARQSFHCFRSAVPVLPSALLPVPL